MEDDELQAIRAARMAELRGAGGSSGGGSSGGVGSMMGSGPSGMPSGQSDRKEEEQAEQQEEMKRQMLSRILDPVARERLARIGLVKPQKARQISDLLIRMAQSGQIRGKITEAQLIGLLDQVDQADNSAPKITFTRKKTVQSDDDDDDFDL